MSAETILTTHIRTIIKYYYLQLLEHVLRLTSADDILYSWLPRSCEISRQVKGQIRGSVLMPRAPIQYRIRRLIVTSRKVSLPRDCMLECIDCFEIWQADRQHCCRYACQNSKQLMHSNMQSRGYETLRDLTVRRLILY